MWEMCCSDSPKVAIAAPRGHSKSTSITLTWALCCLLFRMRDFMVIVSATEQLANAFLKDIAVELGENEPLKAAFGIKGFEKDTESEIIVDFHDGGKFRVIAKGGLQRVRGLKWRNKRPNCIVVDDLEDDVSILNQETRSKLEKWFGNALLPTGSKHCIVRVVGTIIHFSGLLAKLLENKSWHTALFSAHKSFDDFDDILWPEYWTEKMLREKRQEFIDDGNPDGWSSEYLNIPLSSTNAYFKREWLLEFAHSDYDAPKTYYAGVDFAISQRQRADRTVIVIVGVNQYNKCFVEHVRKGRWDSKDIIDNLFAVNEMFDQKIETFFMERGAIEKSLEPILKDEMVERNVFFEYRLSTPTTDKPSRARPLQNKMRAGAFKFDKTADWYADFESELLQFPLGRHDDQVDAFALVGAHIADLITPLSDEEAEQDEWAAMEREHGEQGRNQVTGY